MAEVYTVVVDNSTPVEITGGRVGHFTIRGGGEYGSLWIGGASLSVSYPGGVSTVVDGIYSYPGVNSPVSIYVTSPDEVYAVLAAYNGGSPVTDTLTIFHNR